MDKLVLVTLLKDFLSIQYFISFLSCYTFSWLIFRAQLTKSPVCGITPSVEPSCGKHFKWKMFHQLYKLLCPHLLCKQPLLPSISSQNSMNPDAGLFGEVLEAASSAVHSILRPASVCFMKLSVSHGATQIKV